MVLWTPTSRFGLFTVKAGDNCKSYFTSNNEYKSGSNCGFWEHCCGTCDFRYCCFREYWKLSDQDQNVCTMGDSVIAICSITVGFVFLIVLFIVCCCCPCCCIYKMCRNPRPAAGVNVITVTNTQLVQQQQPVMQYPQYQPVPTQPGYSQPMQTGPYQGQLYAPGPPPSYHVAMSPGHPTCQSAYDGGNAMYPMQPPAQPGVAYMPSEISTQPAYNPAYMQPPNTGY
ncbi:hypothetical protein G5714_021517 [Onychostoma macrolepis]|uniref:Protein shisa-5 n=1 Tax=Onychostoma macrolepis TaxID=369639 RepID=A0A7J6BR67_9TELE|nr:hypothetical protein G5714_021517 [Onychostoma macrolepis]